MKSQSLAKSPIARTMGIALLLPFVLIGCVPIPPRDIPISDVPTVIEPSAHVTVIRKKQFHGSLLTQFISLDGLTIARLEAGQYTTFPVSEGRHVVSVTMNRGELGAAPPVFLVVWFEPRAEAIWVNCDASRNYFVTSTSYLPPDIWSRAWTAIQRGDRHGEDRLQFRLEEIERPEGEFSLEHYTYVLPGPRKLK